MGSIARLEIPVDGKDKEFMTRFEAHLNKNGYPFKKKGRMPDYTYEVIIEEPMFIFWLGCNYTAIQHKLFDGPLTTTG